jgi:hypothetical protein
VVRYSPGSRRLTLGADKACGARVRQRFARSHCSLHIVQNTSGRSSGIDARTTGHPGYEISQQNRDFQRL